MRTVGKGLRQVRKASTDFKDAIGLDELMREDPFRSPPPRPRPPSKTPVAAMTEPADEDTSASASASSESAASSGPVTEESPQPRVSAGAEDDAEGGGQKGNPEISESEVTAEVKS